MAAYAAMLIACSGTGKLPIAERVLPNDELTGAIESPRDIAAAVSLADPHDPAFGAQLDHIAEKVRTVAAARRQERRVGQRDRGHLQSRDRER